LPVERRSVVWARSFEVELRDVRLLRILELRDISDIV
jgi:hypothetical protein